MRKLFLVFLMTLLPLQWSFAVVGQCCARHDTPASQQTMGEHQHHGEHMHQHDTQQSDTQHEKSDCDKNCVGCHAHHGACVVSSLSGFDPAVPAGMGATPYVSVLPDPLPDNLFRPPLSVLA